MQHQVTVRVLFFGAAREIAGADEKLFGFEPETSARDAFSAVLDKFPALNEKFGKSLLFAVNQVYANGSEKIENSDELAIFPPVSGG